MNRSEKCKAFLTSSKGFRTLGPAKLMGRIIFVMLVVSLFVSRAQAQIGDWRSVESLKPGSHVIVKAQHKYSCMVEDANDDQLVCEVHLPRPFRTITLAIPRAEVREVRTLPNQAKDAWIGAGIGGAAGATAAGTNSRDYPGFHAFVGGLAGAGGGALVGATIPIFQYMIQRGHVIYKR